MQPQQYDEYGRPILQRRQILGVDSPAPVDPRLQQPAVSPALTGPSVASVASTMPIQQQQMRATPASYTPAGAYDTTQPTQGIGVTVDGNTGKNMAGLAAKIGTSAGLGLSIDGQSSVDYLRNQAQKGSPLGMMYSNAAGGDRENKLLNAGARQEAAFGAASADLASGKTGSQVYAPVSRALDRLQTAGDPNLQAGTAAAQQASSVAGGMSGDVARLRAAAEGAVPSAAQIQQRQGIGDAINSQQAMAAGARGGNLAAAMRGAQAAGAGIQARGVGDAAALRANEMATARGQLTQATGTQGQLFNQAGSVQGALANTQVGRAGAGVQGAGAAAQGRMGAQVQGVQNLAAGAQMEQGRVGSAVAQDRQDQNDLNNYLMQTMNIGQGNAAQIYGTDASAATARRAQDMNFLGSTFQGVGSTLAGFGSYYK